MKIKTPTEESSTHCWILLEWIWSLVYMNLVKTSGFKSVSEPEDGTFCIHFLDTWNPAQPVCYPLSGRDIQIIHVMSWFQAITSFILLLLCHSEQSVMKPHCWRLSPVRVVKHGEQCQKTCPSDWIMAKLKSSDTDIFSSPHRQGY